MRAFTFLVSAFLVAGFLFFGDDPNEGALGAQIYSTWSPRQRIPGTHDDARTPYLVADSNRAVHAFHSWPIVEEGARRETAIFYNRWTVDGGWTMPIDILLSPFGREAVVRGAFLDSKDIIHIIFYDDQGTGGAIFYSKAPAVRAGQARAWSIPERIGESAFLSHAATLAGDDQGHLYVVYGGNLEGKGLYAVHSLDAGQTWSDSNLVGLTYDDDLFVWDIGLHLDQKQQRLHIVWGFNDSLGRGQEIYYARLDTGHLNWSEPFLLASVKERRLDQVTSPAIISYEDALFVSYMEWQTPPFRVMRRSFDGGLNWTDPVKPFETRGSYGPPNFVIDSSNTLHQILGDRARGLDMWHSIWQGDHWQEPEPIVPLSENQIQEGPLKFHPTAPRTIISQGNVMLVTWTTDTGGGPGNGTWYAYKILDAPELSVQPLLTLPAPSTITPISTDTPVVLALTPSPKRGEIRQGDAPSKFSTNPTDPLIWGILPGVVLIAGFILVHHLYHGRQ